MVMLGPGAANRAEDHAVECLARGGMDRGQVNVAEENGKRDVGERRVDRVCLRDDVEGEPAVLPENQSGDAKRDGAVGGEDRVQLLTGVETSLGRSRGSRIDRGLEEPLTIFRRPLVHVAACTQNGPSVAGERDEGWPEYEEKRRPEMDL